MYAEPIFSEGVVHHRFTNTAISELSISPVWIHPRVICPTHNFQKGLCVVMIVAEQFFVYNPVFYFFHRFTSNPSTGCVLDNPRQHELIAFSINIYFEFRNHFY